MQADNKMIKKREEEIKNRKIYPGSPFLKGATSSPLQTSKDFHYKDHKISLQPLLPTVHTAPRSTHTSASVKPMQKPTAPTPLATRKQTLLPAALTLQNPSADVRPVQKPTAPTQLQTQ